MNWALRKKAAVGLWLRYIDANPRTYKCTDEHTTYMCRNRHIHTETHTHRGRERETYRETERERERQGCSSETMVMS